MSSTDELTGNVDDAGVHHYYQTTLLGTEVPVCWYPEGNDSINGSILGEREEIKKTILETWSGLSSVYFTGWGMCDYEYSTDVRIQVKSATCKSSLGPWRQNDWSMRIRPSHADGAYWMRNCARHEMGHALGFSHEQNRTDAPYCSYGSEGDNADTRTLTYESEFLGPYDPNSIMNYCYFMPNRTEEDKVLSEGDIAGLRAVYGGGVKLASSPYLLGDLNADGRTDVVMPWVGHLNNLNVHAWRWDGTGYTNTAGFTFQRGLAAEPRIVHWSLADLDSDHRAELLAFAPGRALLMASSPWSSGFLPGRLLDFPLEDPRLTQWLDEPSLDVEGDGRRDWIQAGACGASTLLRVHTWSGSAFTSFDRCMTSAQAGTLTWLSGDADGDGRTDVVQVRSRPDGTLGLTVFQGGAGTDGPSFVDRGESAPGAGPVAVRYFMADVDADARAEVVQLWDRGGALAVTVYRLDPASQRYFRFSDSLLTAPAAQEWLAGDVTGDGRADLIGLSQTAGTVVMQVLQAAEAGDRFGELPAVSFPGAQQGTPLTWQLADADGDGLLEVLSTWNLGNRTPIHTTLSSRVENLALGKPATQSSTYDGAVASRATDGSTAGAFASGSVTHTLATPAPWWQVDLGSVRAISDVILFNRAAESCVGLRDGTPGGDCRQRLTSFRLRVSDDGATWQDFPYAGGVFQQTTFAVNRAARFVRVQLNGTGVLSLAEVMVLGNHHNLALGQAAAEWPEPLSPAPAARAVDGRTDGHSVLASVTNTAPHAGAWLDLSLGSERALESVVVFTQTDASTSALNNTNVWLQSAAGEWRYLGTVLDAQLTARHAFEASGFRANRVFLQRNGTVGPVPVVEVQAFGVREPPRSCLDVRTRTFPRPASGQFVIDPDGPGGEPAFQAFCDMDAQGGGWTLISSLSAASIGVPPPAIDVVPGVFGAMPTSRLAALTASASQVQLRTAGVPAASITSVPGLLPIKNLRALRYLNAGSTAPRSEWFGPNANPARLDFSCGKPALTPEALAWPNLYWAGCNETGIHVAPTEPGVYALTWDWSGPASDFEVWVR